MGGAVNTPPTSPPPDYPTTPPPDYKAPAEAASPAEKPMHPWQAVTEASFDRSKMIPGTENLATPGEVIGGTASMLLPGAGGALVGKALPVLGKVGPPIGRALTSGLIGGLEAGSTERGAVDAGLAGAFEAGLAGITRAKVPSFIGGGTRSLMNMAQDVAGRRGAFDKAGQQVGEAIEAIRPRIEDIMRQRGVAPTSRWLNVPALGNGPMTLDEVKRGLMNAEGPAFDAARKQIHRELIQFDKFVTKQGGRSPYSAIDFNSRAAKERFTPPVSSGERTAEKAVGILGNPTLRGIGDAVVGKDEPVAGTGLPIGIAAPVALEDMLGGQTLNNLARRVISR